MLDPPFLRNFPKHYFDSTKEAECAMAPMLKRMRGRVRTVSALFPLPKGALVAGRSTGDCSFDLELAPEAYLWRFDLEGGSRFEINGRTLSSGNSTLASPGTIHGEHVTDCRDSRFPLPQRKKSIISASLAGLFRATAQLAPQVAQDPRIETISIKANS